MTEWIEPRHIGLFTVAVVGGLLVVGAWVYRTLLAFLPMARARREALHRASPVLGTAAGLFYALYVTRTLLESYEGYEDYVPMALAVIVAAFVLASWFAIRDVINGMFLKAGRIATEGDHVRVGDVQGRVETMGLRTMTIETSAGDEAILPYSSIARDSIMRTPVTENSALHTFRLDLPRGLTLADAKARIRHAALRSHWSSLTRDPEIALAENNTLEVSIYALDADHGPDIEMAVRESVARAADPRDRRDASGPFPRAT